MIAGNQTATCVSSETPGAQKHRLPAVQLEAALILALAIALGGFLRFIHLGAAEMTGDEANSWATASASTVAGVIEAHRHVNPGTLALHDLLLHMWILIFGASEAALRSLSALLGTAAIALVFFCTYQLLMLPEGSGDAREADAATAQTVAALSALVTAMSLVMINSSREARMYPLMLAMVLAQIGFFLRGMRRGGWLNFAAIAVFTALTVAANFTAAFVFAAEGAWFAWRLVTERRSGRGLDARAWRSAFAVLAGLAMLAPFASLIGSQLSGGMTRGIWSWIVAPQAIDPLQTFESASGGWVFALAAALALWGMLTRWRRYRGQIEFALILMWLPPLAQLTISYLFMPMDVARYVLPSFIAFYILTAIGIAAFGSARSRGLAAVLLALAMLTHVYRYDSKPRDRSFREAVALAIKLAPDPTPIGVVSWDGSNRSAYYYAPADRRADLVRLPEEGELSPAAAQIQTVILPTYMRPAELAHYRTLFPRVDGTFRMVEVRSR